METYAGMRAAVEVDSHLDLHPSSGAVTVWGTCFECDRIVELGVERIALPLVTPALAMAALNAFGAITGTRRTGKRRALLEGLLGHVVGGATYAASPVVQKWVCGYCGCDDVKPHLE